MKDCPEIWHKKIVTDGRENWHKKIVMDGRENWHKKIVTDGRENWHKKIVMDGRGKLAQEDHDGLPRTIAKLKRERTDLRDGLPGKIEKVVMHEQKQVERVVMHEQEKVEKILKGSRRVDGVLWRHRSHVATRRCHMRESNMGKQFHPVMHNIRKPCCVVQNIGFDSFIDDLSSVDRSVV